MGEQITTKLKVDDRLPSQLTDAAIHDQLQRILSSPDFRATETQRNFFRFVVTETLAGKVDTIKGYTIATRVFGRGSDFDQATDPIVSIQAHKLRRALERYYLTAGKNDAIRIDMPKGTYVPRFDTQPIAQDVDAVAVKNGRRFCNHGEWPSVLVRPFQNCSNDSEYDYLGTGLAMELANQLTMFPDIRVLAYSSCEVSGQVDQHPAHFEITGTIFSDGATIKLSLGLIDTKSGEQIWSDTNRCAMDTAALFSFQENVARIVAVNLAGEQGVIAKTLVHRAKVQPPGKTSVYDALLLFYDWELRLTDDCFSRAFSALNAAVVAEPRCGQSWSLLARMCADIYALDIPDVDDPLPKAVEYAVRGIQLAPDNQRTRGTMAQVHLHSNEISAGLAEAQKALSIGSNSLFLLDGIGYLLTLLGNWEQGTTLIRKVMKLNPFYNNAVHYALWVDWLRQGKYEKACQETIKIHKTPVFWYPLARAASFGLVGRIQEGRQHADELVKCLPDFSERGRMLIARYIKFNDIEDRIAEGLRNVGIDLV